ncbi:MAG: rhomboid family intramembrane serine protease [Thermomicrobiales bacterium]
MDRSQIVVIAASVLVMAGGSALFFVTQMAIGKRVRGPFPLSAVVVLAVSTIISVIALGNERVMHALQRNPGDLQAGKFWKLFTPLLIQSDGWSALALKFVVFLLVAFVAERVYGRRRFLLMYFVPGAIGQLAGFAWDSPGGGNSVALAGLVGGFFMLVLVHPHRVPRPGLMTAGLGLIAAAVMTLGRDMHGPPVLAGAILGYALNRASPMLPHHAEPS